jgi:hypothetical protein
MCGKSPTCWMIPDLAAEQVDRQVVNFVLANPDLARVWLIQAIDHLEQGRLSTT